MPAPISVIVPTLNAAAHLPANFARLVEALEAGLIREVIVIDGGSGDETLEIAKTWGAEVHSVSASRGGQLKLGCAKARGEWLLVLHADTCLSQGWSQAAMKHLKSQQAGWFQLRFDEGGMAGYLVASWANFRSRFLGLPYGDQGILVPKSLYLSVGGYPEIKLMEDVALSRALSGQLRRIDAFAITDAHKYKSQGWLRRGSRNLLFLLGYFLGRDPDQLSNSYDRM